LSGAWDRFSDSVLDFLKFSFTTAGVRMGLALHRITCGLDNLSEHLVPRSLRPDRDTGGRRCWDCSESSECRVDHFASTPSLYASERLDALGDRMEVVANRVPFVAAIACSQPFRVKQAATPVSELPWLAYGPPIPAQLYIRSSPLRSGRP
jgi:hypothetical protein